MSKKEDQIRIDWRFEDHHEFCRYPNSTHSHYCYHATGHCDQCNQLKTRDHCPLVPITKRVKYHKMNDLQKAIANAFKLQIDALAETATISEVDAVINTAVNVAIAIEKHDSTFDAKEFLAEVEISDPFENLGSPVSQ